MLSVLLVDDDPVLLDLARIFLERTGEFRVETAVSGPDAIRMLETMPVDAVVADYEMPEMTGIALLQLVRDRWADLPFLIFTGRGREEVVIEALNRGADFYLQKGGDPRSQFAELQHMIRHAVSQRMAGEEIQRRQARLDSIFRASPVGIGVVRDRVLLEVNQRICDMTGYTEAELVGTGARILYPTDEDFQYVGREKYRQIEETGTGTVETRWQRKDGAVMDILLSSAPIRAGDPSAEITFTALDITGRKQGEQAVRESEALYRTLTETSPDMVYLISTDGTIRYVNSVAAAQFLTTPSRIAGRRLEEVFDPSTAARHRKAMEAVISSGAMIRRELYEEFPAGGAWVGVRLSPVRDAAGRITAVLGLSHDITDWKGAEAQLKEAEERHRRLLEHSFDGVVIHSGGKIRYANPPAAAMLGAETPEQMQGMEVLDFVHPSSRAAVTNRIRRMSEEEDLVVPLMEEQFLALDGRVIDVEVIATSFTYRGSPAVQVVFRDITGRKQADKALRESEERFRTLVEESPLGMHMYRLEPDGSLVFTGANPAADGILGIDNRQFVGKTIEEAFPSFTGTALPDEYRRVVATGIPWRAEQVEYHDARISGAFEVHAFRTSPSTMASLFYDISERLRATAAVRAAQAKLALMNEITRHDVRNQLMAMQGYLALLSEGLQDGDATGLVEKIGRVGDAIAHHIDFMKDYQSIGADAPRWIPVQESIRSSWSAISRDGVGLELDLEGLEVFADPLLWKVFYNIFENSLLHGETVTEMRWSFRQSHGGTEIIFQDNGTGIPEGEKEKIFRRGYGKGTGYGLFLARQILSITGLSIRETGTPGGGARFEILVPGGGFRTAP